MKFTPNLTRSEQRIGLITLAVCMFLLPGVLALVMPDAGAALLNFTCYFITAGAAVYVLRRFLLRNLAAALAQPFRCFYIGCVGYLAHLALSELVFLVVYLIAPGFANLNDANMTALLGADFGLMALVAIVLAPISEECFFRGLLFRGLYDRSPVLAWALSVGLFAAMHVIGYIGAYTPLETLLAFIQYLPAGVALCIAYQRGGSIISPILTHAIVNAMALWQVLS